MPHTNVCLNTCCLCTVTGLVALLTPSREPGRQSDRWSDRQSDSDGVYQSSDFTPFSATLHVVLRLDPGRRFANPVLHHSLDDAQIIFGCFSASSIYWERFTVQIPLGLYALCRKLWSCLSLLFGFCGKISTEIDILRRIRADNVGSRV